MGEFVNEQQKQYEALHKVVEISHKFNDLPVRMRVVLEPGVVMVVRMTDE